jgi:adenylate cyclase
MNGPVERTFSIVDVAGFTALTESHGDVHAADLAEHLISTSRALLTDQDVLVKSLGDAVLLASRETPAALALVKGLFKAFGEVDRFPLLRAGLHRGIAERRGDDYFGAAVNLAARVAASAMGSQVMATEPVGLAARALGYGVHDAGTHSLRNIGQPTRLFEIEVFDQPEHRAVDPMCRMSLDVRDAYAALGEPHSRVWFCSASCLEQYVESKSHRAEG